MTKDNEKEKRLSTILTDLGFDFVQPCDLEGLENEDEILEWLQERINEQEIIYYHVAIDYLKENDPSLMESLELANEYGYEAKNLNSEILATILYQSNLSQNAGTVASKLWAVIEQFQEEESDD